MFSIVLIDLQCLVENRNISLPEILKGVSNHQLIDCDSSILSAEEFQARQLGHKTLRLTSEENVQNAVCWPFFCLRSLDKNHAIS